MKKIIIQVGLELVFGPILKNNKLDDGSLSSGSNIVDDDPIINDLDKKTNELWISLFSKDENSSSGFKFDYEKEKALAPELLNLINLLLKRLNEINDGSYELQDMISEHLQSLIQ